MSVILFFAWITAPGRILWHLPCFASPTSSSCVESGFGRTRRHRVRKNHGIQGTVVVVGLCLQEWFRPPLLLSHVHLIALLLKFSGWWMWLFSSARLFTSALRPSSFTGRGPVLNKKLAAGIFNFVSIEICSVFVPNATMLCHPKCQDRGLKKNQHASTQMMKVEWVLNRKIRIKKLQNCVPLVCNIFAVKMKGGRFKYQGQEKHYFFPDAGKFLGRSTMINFRLF